MEGQMVNKTEKIKEVIRVWNTHNLQNFMDLHADDLEWTSPLVEKLTQGQQKSIIGKDKIKPYWQKALEHYPNINHEIIGVFEGADSVSVLYYSTAKEKKIIDVMYFDDNGKVKKLNVYYAE